MNDKTSTAYLEACWQLALALDGNTGALSEATAWSDGELASRPDGDAAAVAERNRRGVLRIVAGGGASLGNMEGASASAAAWLQERGREPGYPSSWTAEEFDEVSAWMGGLAQDYAKAAVSALRRGRG
jgi:hypothetical protein